jgi:hypothetical protein
MKITYLICILSVIFASACSSTGKSAKKYPPKFYDYPPTEQSLIRGGKIAVGFDEAQVRMAWGNPSRIRSDSVSNRYYWEYLQLEAEKGFLKQVGDTISRGGNPAVITRQDPFHERVRKRVTFDTTTRTVSSFKTFY